MRFFLLLLLGGLPLAAAQDPAASTSPSGEGASATSSSADPSPQADPRPNILWITIDDAGPDLGCYGSSVVATPRLDGLAARGQRFEHCWTSAPVCSPARSSLITGCTPQTIGSHQHRSTRALPEGIRPVTGLLRDGGYQIAKLPLERQNAQAFADGAEVGAGRLATVTGGAKQDFNFSRGTNLFQPWEQRDPKAPFFSLVDFHGPKTGQGTGKAHAWAEATGNVVDPAGLELPPYWVDAPAVREAYARYFEGMALLDAEVGRVLDWLEAEGLAENTWVFVWGDHGLAMVRHKQWCYESGLRVPLLAMGPGLEAGVRSDLVSSVDLAATTLGVSGMPVPSWMEGRDLFAADHEPRELLFAGRDRCDESEDRVRAVRDGRFSLIHNLRPELSWLGRNEYTLKTFPGEQLLLDGRAAGTLTEAQAAIAATTKPKWELFDLQADPLQLVNLSGRAELAEVEARLRESLLGWTARVDAGNPFPEELDTIVPDKARTAVVEGRAAAPQAAVVPKADAPEEPDPAPEPAPRRRGPNVLLVLADDLGYGELGCYGQSKIKTPNLDALAAGGVRFAQAYSGHAVCAPARAVLLTGLHTGHAPVRNNSPWASAKNPEGEGQEPLPEGQPNLARWFQDAGVATGAFGKWGLGGPGTVGAPQLQGFDTFFGYLCQKQAHDYYPAHLWRNDQKVVLRNPGYTPAARFKEAPEDASAYAAFSGEDYAPDLMLEAALDFVDAEAQGPFFLYYPSPVPHAALQVPQDSVEPYLAQAWDTAPYLGEQGYLPHPTPRAAYAAMITRLDRDVGRLLARLEERGVAQNTLVIFTSDNGPTFNGGVELKFFDSTRGPIGAKAREGGKLRGKKGGLYEGGIRVPMIVHWPGHLASGTVVERPVGFQDLWPTLAELQGLPIPAGLDGTSFAKTLLGTGEDPAPSTLYWESGRSQALRAGSLKLVRKVDRQGRVVAELFDLDTDPGETQNLAESRPEDLARLVSLARSLHTPSKTFPSPFDSGL